MQFALSMVLLGSLLLLVMAGVTRYTVGEPVLPQWAAGVVHHPEAALPPGMTSDFAVINPATKRTYRTLPEVGEIEMRLAVTNDSALPIKLHFDNGNQAEFIVRRVFTYVDDLFAVPLEVWRSSYFHVVSPKPVALVLQPGQSTVYSATLELSALNERQMPPGAYIIVAVFNGRAVDQHDTRGAVAAVQSIRMDKPL